MTTPPTVSGSDIELYGLLLRTGIPFSNYPQNIMRIGHVLEENFIVRAYSFANVPTWRTHFGYTLQCQGKPTLILVNIDMCTEEHHVIDTLFHEGIHATAGILNRDACNDRIGDLLEEICANFGAEMLWCEYCKHPKSACFVDGNALVRNKHWTELNDIGFTNPDAYSAACRNGKAAATYLIKAGIVP